MSSVLPLNLVALRIDWHRVTQLSIAEVSDGLTTERLERIASFVRLEDRYRCAFAGHLIDFLYRQSNPGRRSPALTKGPHGKPEFAEPCAPAFNISHSGDWVVGISGQSPVGIDVEAIKPKAAVLHDALTPEELQDLENVPASHRASYFIQLWTLKEAHLKAQGLGLSAGVPLHLSFRIGTDGIATLAGDNSPLVHCCGLLDTDHAFATCTPPPRPALLSVIDAINILRARYEVEHPFVERNIYWL